MKVVQFKKSFNIGIGGDPLEIKKGYDYVFSEIIYQFLIDGLKRAGIKEKAIVKSARELSDVYPVLDLSNVDDPVIHPVLIVRTGGIGDLIALSSLVKLLRDHGFQDIHFISQGRYADVFDWFEEGVRFIPYFHPIGKRKRFGKRTFSVYFEGVIEASKVNWFELQARVINTEFNPKYGRPYLKTDRITDAPSNIDRGPFTILLNPRSTAVIRSMSLRDLYTPLKRVLMDLGVSDHLIYVHVRNLTKVDEEWIKENKDPKLKVIQADGLGQFFLDIYDSDFVLCVDTAMIHFREGIQKPGLGIYGPFPMEARTKYYKFVSSVDIRSQCPMSPCFIHTKSLAQVCPTEKLLFERGLYPKEALGCAPCLNSNYVEDLEEQIYGALRGEIGKVLG